MVNMQKRTLGELYTHEELTLAAKCKTAEEIEALVIMPAIDRINHLTGQKNHPKYLAYVLEHVLQENRRGKCQPQRNPRQN